MKRLRIREIAEKNGKIAFLLAVSEILPETLLEFPTLEAYVNTACPRISFDAPAKFSKPVLTIDEFMVVSGEFSWQNLLKKGLFGRQNLERFLSQIRSHPSPKVSLEQYTTSETVGCGMLYLAAYANGDIIGKECSGFGLWDRSVSPWVPLFLAHGL